MTVLVTGGAGDPAKALTRADVAVVVVDDAVAVEKRGGLADDRGRGGHHQAAVNDGPSTRRTAAMTWLGGMSRMQR